MEMGEILCYSIYVLFRVNSNDFFQAQAIKM